MLQKHNEPVERSIKAQLTRSPGFQPAQKSLNVFLRHPLDANVIRLQPTTEFGNQPNLRSDRIALESMFVQLPRKRIDVRHQWAFGCAQQGPQPIVGLFHL
ncbi:MAG: hypothetical protein WCF44_09850, partial [Candidatus Methylophosphatis roskildensis]